MREWNEGLIGSLSRSVRGGSLASGAGAIGADTRLPGSENNQVGFRVASVVPEPGTGLLVMTGLLGLGFYRRANGGGEPEQA